MTSTERIRVYLAGPLFTQAEWLWNERLAKELNERAMDVVVPQRRAEPMLTGQERFDASILFKANVEAIDGVTVVVAVLDGADADSGTAWECGYAYKAGKPIIGVRTDIRAGGDDAEAGINLMLSMCSESLVVLPIATRNDLCQIADSVADAVRKVTQGHG